jgi:hypothetical protein
LAEVNERGANAGAAGTGAAELFANRVGLARTELEEAVGARSTGDDPMLRRGLPFGI